MSCQEPIQQKDKEAKKPKLQPTTKAPSPTGGCQHQAAPATSGRGQVAGRLHSQRAPSSPHARQDARTQRSRNCALGEVPCHARGGSTQLAPTVVARHVGARTSNLPAHVCSSRPLRPACQKRGRGRGRHPAPAHANSEHKAITYPGNTSTRTASPGCTRAYQGGGLFCKPPTHRQTRGQMPRTAAATGVHSPATPCPLSLPPLPRESTGESADEPALLLRPLGADELQTR